jgi:hypothetical protein
VLRYLRWVLGRNEILAFLFGRAPQRHERTHAFTTCGNQKPPAEARGLSTPICDPLPSQNNLDGA